MVIESIRSRMIQYEEYQTVDILSEQQAFKQLEKGEVNNVYLKYLDSTQPIYNFLALNNNQSSSILIPDIGSVTHLRFK